MEPIFLQKQEFSHPQKTGPSRHTLSEVFPNTVTDAAALGYVLSCLPRTGAPILWVQDRLSARETGRPYLAGIGAGRPVITIDLSRPIDVLWALENGLRCHTLAAVIGELWGDPTAVDFTATKRLALRSEASNVPCWLIRHAATPNLSAARARWRIGSAPAAPHPHDQQAPGMPRWSLDLFRAHHARPAKWTVTYDRTTDRVDQLPPLRNREVGARDGEARQRTGR